ncbi:hypothetical protein OAB57_03750 [Bacteriovoracaceae bacterium]|nr:hypothetical protein [Bacteriovoracaceae bacterium]
MTYFISKNWIRFGTFTFYLTISFLLNANSYACRCDLDEDLLIRYQDATSIFIGKPIPSKTKYRKIYHREYGKIQYVYTKLRVLKNYKGNKDFYRVRTKLQQKLCGTKYPLKHGPYIIFTYGKKPLQSSYCRRVRVNSESGQRLIRDLNYITSSTFDFGI